MHAARLDEVDVGEVALVELGEQVFEQRLRVRVTARLYGTEWALPKSGDKRKALE